MMSTPQNREEQLTADDLQYIRLALILALGNEDIKVMPKSESQLKILHTKVDRMYHKQRAVEEEAN